MGDQMNDSKLIHFLNRKTSTQENEEILLWVSSSEENRNQFREIHQVFQVSKQKLVQSEIDIEQAWDKLNNKLPKTKIKAKVISLEIFNRIAVSVLVILAVGFGSLWVNDHFVASPKSGLVVFEAPSGEKSKIVLADGSQVWLNSETKLQYDAMNPRSVILNGEAYFEVKKDRSHPFLILTSSGMKVKVTGTKFNLRSYNDESFVETSLEEGEVIIEGKNSNKLAVLKPGQQSKYDVKSQKIKVQNVSSEIYSIWRNNELRFSDITFEDLVPRIERWYGISIKLDSGIEKNDRFTMTIKTESLRELLTMMQLTSKFNYEINGSFVEIKRK
ncbi:MAG TPA: FecR domain-containing protein [Prolixibacteraceae bacterium]|nr:FecR domain-containing protein [Prolixibacteraceae bacterium]